MNDIKPIFGLPLLNISTDEGNTLVLSDLHLGTAREWRKKGINVNNVEETKLLLNFIRRQSYDKIILLGDVKATNFGFKTWEKNELINFLNRLGVPIEIVRGNHDGGLSELIFEKTIIHKDLVVFKKTINDNVIAFAHGHLLNSSFFENTDKLDYLIIGHFHPSIIIKDKVGATWHSKVWLFGELELFDSKLKVIIMPSSNPMITGLPLNRDKQIFNEIQLVIGKERFSLASFEVMTLDFIKLGKLEELVI